MYLQFPSPQQSLHIQEKLINIITLFIYTSHQESRYVYLSCLEFSINKYDWQPGFRKFYGGLQFWKCRNHSSVFVENIKFYTLTKSPDKKVMTVIQIRVAFYGCINQKTAVGNLCDQRRFAEHWPLDTMLSAQRARSWWILMEYLNTEVVKELAIRVGFKCQMCVCVCVLYYKSQKLIEARTHPTQGHKNTPAQ